MYSKILTTSLITGTSSKRINTGFICSYHDLPQEKVLSIAQAVDKKSIELKIYSIHDVTTCLIEKIFEGNYKFLGVFPNGSILMEKTEELSDTVEVFLEDSIFSEERNALRKQLIKLSPDNLEISESQEWKENELNTYRVRIINNESFFVIDHGFDYNCESSLTFFRWEGNSFNKGKKQTLICEAKLMDSEIHFLEENTYGCEIQSKESNKLLVLIFELYGKEELIKFPPVKLNAWPHVNLLMDPVKMINLPHGKFLAFHPYEDKFQIWDIKRRRCIKEMNWSDQIHENAGCKIDIKPLPDSSHLLLRQVGNFYLFNTKELKIKKIASPDCMDYGDEFHILSTGKVILFNPSIKKDFIKVTTLDLPEMKTHQNNQDVILNQTGSDLSHKGLARTTSDAFLSFRPTQIIGKTLFRNIAESELIEDNEENSNCSPSRCS